MPLFCRLESMPEEYVDCKAATLPGTDQISLFRGAPRIKIGPPTSVLKLRAG